VLQGAATGRLGRVRKRGTKTKTVKRDGLTSPERAPSKEKKEIHGPKERKREEEKKL